MPGQERIDSIINLSAIKVEVGQLNDWLDNVESKMKSIQQTMSNYKGATGFQEQKKATEELSNSFTNLINNEKEYDAIMQRINQRMNQMNGQSKEFTQLLVMEARAQKDLSQAKLNEAKAATEVSKAKTTEAKASQQSTKAKQDEKKVMAELSSEYKILSKAAAEASLRAKDYALTLGSSHPITKQATAEALALNTKLKELDASTGVYNRNVGNYSSVLTGYANTLRGLRGPTKLLGEAMGLGASAADQLRITVEHLIQGMAALLRGKEASRAATEANTAAILKNTALTKENTVATELLNVATNTNTTATNKNTAATVAAEAASSKLTKALRFAGIAFLVTAVATAIGFLIYKLVSATKSIDVMKEKQKELTEALKDKAYTEAIQNVQQLKEDVQLAKDGFIEKEKVVKEYNETMGKTVGQVKTLSGVEKNLADKTDAYLQFMLLRAAANIALGKAAEAAEKQQEALLKMGTRSDDVLEKGTTEEIKRLNAIQEELDAIIPLEIKVGETIDKNGKLIKHSLSDLPKDTQQRVQSLQSEYDALIKTISDRRIPYNLKLQEKSFLDIFKSFRAEAAKIAKDGKFKLFDFEDDDKSSHKLKEYFNAQLEEMKDAWEELAKNGDADIATRILARKKQFDVEKQLLKEKLDFDIAQNKGNNEAIADLNTKFKKDELQLENKKNSDILKLEKEFSLKLKKTREESAKSIKETIDRINSGDDAHRKSEKEKRLEEINNEYAHELELLDKKYEKQIKKDAGNKEKLAKDEERYQKKRAEIIFRQNRDILIADIEFAQSEIEIAKARAALIDDPIKKQAALDAIGVAESKLNGLRLKLTSLLTQHKIEENKREEKSDEELINKKIEKLQKWADYAKTVMSEIAGIMSASIERQKNDIQSIEDAQQQNYESEVQRINNSTLADQDKANKLKILEAQRQAQKEQNARKQRQLDIEKAKFDKAASIAEIILNTASAIMKFLAKGNVAESIAAGIIGSLQLAKAISTPLPKYEKGGTVPKDQIALTDEKGPEMYVLPDGSMFFGNNQPTLRKLQKGTKIIPHEEVVKMSTAGIFEKQYFAPRTDASAKEIRFLRQEIRDITTWQTNELTKAYRNKKSLNVFVSGDFKNSDHIRKAVYE